MEAERLGFRRAVSVGHPVLRSDAVPAIITVVELWEDRLVIRWNEREAPADPAGRAWEPLFSVEDDVGTAYERVEAGNGSRPRQWDCYVAMSPGPPEDAREVRLAFWDGSRAVITVA